MNRLILPVLLLAAGIACGGDTANGVPETAPAADKADKSDMGHDKAGEGHDMAAMGHDMGDALGAYQPITATDSKVYFETPSEGSTVTSPLHVVFGAVGVTIQPAGELVANTGHHHLVIDGKPVPEGEAVPADATHIHFGKGQTETDVELTPGKHTLTMQLADGLHRSYGPAYADTVTVMVAGGAAE